MKENYNAVCAVALGGWIEHSNMCKINMWGWVSRASWSKVCALKIIIIYFSISGSEFLQQPLTITFNPVKFNTFIRSVMNIF